MILNKNFLKTGAIFAVIVGVAISAIWLADYYKYRKSPQYAAEKLLSEMEKRYAEDTYGGNTPEETLRLFIDALKAGDIDLASKYFVVDKQEEWRGKIEEIKSNGKYEILISEIERAKKTLQEDARVFFEAVNEEGVVNVSVIFVKSINNRWKISEL